MHPARPALVTNPPTFQSSQSNTSHAQVWTLSLAIAMARKKIREYDSKRLLKENLKRLAGIDLTILSAQVSAPVALSPFSSASSRDFPDPARPAWICLRIRASLVIRYGVL